MGPRKVVEVAVVVAVVALAVVAVDEGVHSGGTVEFGGSKVGLWSLSFSLYFI